MFKPNVLAEPVLVGREKELEELQGFLNSAVEGKGKTVFVSGEAGSGKTRLVHEFLEVAKRKGVDLMAGWCLSDSAAPYFPFVEAFNNYCTDLETERPENLRESGIPIVISSPFQTITQERGITAWLTKTDQTLKRGKFEADSTEVWKDQVFAGVAKTLHIISSQKPLILFIEDVQWADSASQMLLHYVARAIRDSEKVLLLMTFRSEELTSDSEGHPHPLTETLRIMRREELFTEIKLSSLNQENVTRIAENMIGGTLNPLLIQKLTSESKGNPLFVVESLRMLHERKSLIQDKNQWSLAVDELGIPNKIKDIILRRLACLNYAQRRILDAASVIGEEFDVDLLSTVLGQDSLEVLETLNQIAHSTSLVRVEENHYRFDHSRSRETLYEELSAPLKRGYHRRVAEKLENTKIGALPLSDLAFHYTEAGDTEKAVKYALATGKDELAKWGNAEAIRHFNYVLDAIGEDPKCSGEKESALGGLADAFLAISLFKEAEKTFEQLANLTQKDAVKLRALRMAVFSAFSRGDTSRTSELLNKAEAYASSNRLENARMLMLKGRVLTLQNSLQASTECNKAALRVFEEEYSLNEVALCLLSIGSQRVVTGDLDGLAENLRAVALFEDLGSFSQQMIADYLAGGAFSNCLLWPEALNMYARIIEIDSKTKVGNYSALAYSYGFSSQIYECLGEFEKALSLSLKALEISSKTDSLVNQGQAFSNLTVQYARLEDVKSAEECFGKLMKLPPEIRSHFFVPVPLAKAAFDTAKEQWKEANKYFIEIFERLEKSRGNFFSKARTRLLYAWSREKQGCFEDTKRQIEEVQKMCREAEDRFAHANLQAHLMVCSHVVEGEEFEMRLDLVNVGRHSSLLVKVENLLLDNFRITNLPPWCNIKNASIEMRGKKVKPFQVETIKMKLKTEKVGSFSLNAEVYYADDLNNIRTFKLNPTTINVEASKPAYETLPGRVATGTAELDELLFGGIPEKYAIVLIAPSSNERQQLVKRFIEVGPPEGAITIYLTCQTSYAEELIQMSRPNSFIIICNSQADSAIPSLPNVIKLKGIDSLTEINIALTKLLRTITLVQTNQKRLCMDLLSDVLLQHHAVTTRKWLSELIVMLKSKSFTTLAVLDPLILPEEVPSITSLFDGEIKVSEKESEEGLETVLRIRKLYNQKFRDDELRLKKKYT
jgi:KaiC/GvpD/RAD55 family RecA-like ATPase/tetratricopeptide (TPR) repeat protein